MLRNLALSWMLAVTLATGMVPAVPVLPAAASIPSRVASQALPAAGLAAAVQAQAPAAAAVQLSASEMGAVRGGFWNWFKTFVSAITQIAKVLGAIMTIVSLFRSVFQSTPSNVQGGETVQRNETETIEYSSEENYQAGVASSTTNTPTSAWQQTEVWYGSSGGCDGGIGSGPQVQYYQSETAGGACM